MKKWSLLIIAVVFMGVLSGCTPEETQKLNQSLNTLQGKKSVIMDVSFDVYQDDALLGGMTFDLFVNKEHNWTSLQMMSEGHNGELYQDYRFVFYDLDNQRQTYYEYKDTTQDYSRKTSNLNDKDNYVFMKSSQGHFNLTQLMFSIEQVSDMIEKEAVTLEPIESNDDLTLYELSINLDYFIESNRTVLDALYGYKVSELTDLSVLNGIEQKITVGYDEQDQLKYFSYDQQAVMDVLDEPFSNIVVTINIDSVGDEAVLKMSEIENSDIFPTNKK